MDNQNPEQSRGDFKETISLEMAKLNWGITSVKRGIQDCKDGRKKMAFVCFNARGREVMRGLCSESMAKEQTIPANAYISKVEYVKDGKVNTCQMLHHSASNLELVDFEEGEE